MRYMRKQAYNPNHAFKLLDCGINIRKPELIYNCIKQTQDYKNWKQEENKKEILPDADLEIMLYGKIKNII